MPSSSPKDPTTAYAKDISSGRKPSVLSFRQACERHLSDLKKSKTSAFKYRFDPELAERFFDFCRTLLTVEDPVKGDGNEIPMELTPFQKFVAGNIFGWVKKENGKRRFTETYWEISKGSGKSPLAAAMMLYLLIADGEFEAMIQLCAKDYKQSGVVAETMGRFVERNPLLSSTIQVNTPNSPSGFIYTNADGVKSRVIRLAAPQDATQSAKGLAGPRVSGAVIDEIHDLPSDAVYQAIVLNQKNRTQPLIVMATNSGKTMESFIGRIHQRSMSVLAGTLEQDFFFPVIIVKDEDTDPLNDESLWPALHPDLGNLLPVEKLVNERKRAKGSPDTQAEIERLFFGTWNPKQTNTLFDKRTWIACESEHEEFDAFDLSGLPCFLGLDLSVHNDLTALAAVWVDETEDEENPIVYARAWPFLPSMDLEARYAREQVPYHRYAQDGHLTVAGEERIEYEHVAWVVSQLMDKHNVRALAYDRYKMNEFKAAMERRGVEFWEFKESYPLWRGKGVELVEHAQGLSHSKRTLLMETSISVLEKWVLNKNMRARFNPLLRHHVVDGGEIEYGLKHLSSNRRFVSSAERVARNDCIVALTQACGVAQRWLNMPAKYRHRDRIRPEDRVLAH